VLEKESCDKWQHSKVRISLGCLVALGLLTAPRLSANPLADVIATVQPKVVKVHGAGGLRGLEAYQSGFLISATGHVLTAWSYVLDSEDVSVTLDDGRRFTAELLGMDPRLEIAILKIDASELLHFPLASAISLEVGDRVLAFCNVYGVATGDEPVSVLHGHVAAVTKLSGRRGRFPTPYAGPIYVLDAMTNNAGAAGGVLTNAAGQIAGVLGKEIRDAESNIWLNYAIPVAELTEAVSDILAGKARPRVADDDRPIAKRPWSLPLIGLQLVPDLLPRTPPFVHFVLPASPAEKLRLQPDDLIMYIDGVLVRSVDDVVAELTFRDRDDPVILSVMRDQELVTVEIEPTL
jgi:serine protease Do